MKMVRATSAKGISGLIEKADESVKFLNEVEKQEEEKKVIELKQIADITQ